MKRTLGVVFTLILVCQFAKSQVPYVSPGIGIAWDFGGHFIVSPKLSIGMIQNGVFYNMTVGRSSVSGEKTHSHYYVEVQCGALTEPMEYKKTQLFYGGGIGLTIPSSDSESTVSLRVSAFTGYFVFLNATVLFTEKPQTELGGEVVLPLPLKKIDFGPGNI